MHPSVRVLVKPVPISSIPRHSLRLPVPSARQAQVNLSTESPTISKLLSNLTNKANARPAAGAHELPLDGRGLSNGIPTNLRVEQYTRKTDQFERVGKRHRDLSAYMARVPGAGVGIPTTRSLPDLYRLPLEGDDDDVDCFDPPETPPPPTGLPLPVPDLVSPSLRRPAPLVRDATGSTGSTGSFRPLSDPLQDLNRHHHHHSRSSSSSSSISTLGSIHSAPELLTTPSVSTASTLEPPLRYLATSIPSLVPLRNDPIPPPDDDDDCDHVRDEHDRRAMHRKNRESIAVMEEHSARYRQSHSDEQDDQITSHDIMSSPDAQQLELDEEEEDRVEPSHEREHAHTRQPHLVKRKRRRKREFPSTLWEYLKQEVMTVQIDGEQGIRSERVTNFLTVPRQLEKIICFGVIVCFDSFLYTFTILPLRALSALSIGLSRLVCRSSSTTFGLSHKCDLIRMIVVIATVVGLHQITDASKMYHGVRGQETIKLYVLFNVLEIADRLCCSFGQDLSDSLFSSSTLSRTKTTEPLSFSRILKPWFLLILYTGYVMSHALVLFYQLVTLNVAVNSYNNALLTLLLSNQFVEIKGSVFKKFEKENLFQMTCADIVERFQLALMLLIISVRNLIELSSSSPSSPTSLTTSTASAPSSSSLLSVTTASITMMIPTLKLVFNTFKPGLTVLISECFVDWLKHSFITKFNHIRPEIYARFMDVLSKDLVQTSTPTSSSFSEPISVVDQSHQVSKRLGFASLPLSCLIITVALQTLEIVWGEYESGFDECLWPRSVPTTTTTPLSSLTSSMLSRDRQAQQGWLENGFDIVRVWIRHLLSGGRIYGQDWWRWFTITCVVLSIWISLITLKLLIGINLRTFATARWNGLERKDRELEDTRNGRNRKPIGITPQETVEMEQTQKLLRDKQYDEPARRTLGAAGAGEQLGLEDLGRYDMVKSRLY
ncbi:Emp65p [Sporobolomyces koalae]|uniref:Emp65p n=1 Tax=Sporobolomyces koalae TaxID=500713 RepID=UPI00317E90D4